MTKDPDSQPSILQSLDFDKSFYQVYVMEAITKEQLKMQQKQLVHQKVVMELKIENLKLEHKVRDLQEKHDLSECSKKLLEMRIDKLRCDVQFLQSKIKIREKDINDGDNLLEKKKQQWKEQEKKHIQKINTINNDNQKKIFQLNQSKQKLITQHQFHIQQLKKTNHNDIEEIKKNNHNDIELLKNDIELLKKDSDKVIQKLNKEKNDVQTQNTILKQDLNQERNKSAKLSSQISSITEFLGLNFKNYSAQVGPHKNHDLITLAKQKLDEYQAEIKNARQSLNKFEESQGLKGSSLNNFIDKVHKDLENSKATIKEAKSNVQKLKNQNQQLKNTIKGNQDQLNDMRETQKKLTEKIGLLSQSINALTKKENQLNVLNGKLKIELQKCKQQIKQKGQQTNENIQKNQHVIRQKQQQFTRCNNELQKLTPMLKQKQQQIDKLYKEIQQLKDKIDTQQNQINRLENQRKELSEKCQTYKQQLSTYKKQSEGLDKSQTKLQQMQRQLAKLANKHREAHKKQQEEIQQYHQAFKYFQNLISQSSSSSTPKKQDLFPVPSLSKTFEYQQNWINNLIQVYSNSKNFTSKFVARFEFISPRELQTYLSEPNILIICQTCFKKVFGIFICKLSKLVKDNDPVVLFSSDYSLTYPNQPKKGINMRPAMIVNSKLALAKKQVVIQKSLQVCLQKGQYFGEIDKFKLFGIQDNSNNFKIQKMQIHRIIPEQ